MTENKIRVVWLCHFSNAFVHEKLDLRRNIMIDLIMRITRKPANTNVPEFANWITNGIREFEKFDDVELHVVSPYPYLKWMIQTFEANGIYYHFFRSEDDSFRVNLYKRVFHPSHYSYKHNCKIISSIVNKINPDIVHLFGAEMPNYALGLISINDKFITIAQLQTLMSDPAFKENYPLSKANYIFKSGVEQLIINKADFIGTPALKYRQIILKDINPQAVILNTGLALKDHVVKDESYKQYDFVYFSADISKAVDLAIEAFAIAYKHKPEITLDIIGGYNAGFKQYLDTLIEKYGIADAITFEGKLASHEDVLRQIRKSRFALLPLKIDLTSGTIREAMSNGLPVVTTDTGELGTQKLNLIRKNVLISPIGDHQALADNMLLLIDDEQLADCLRQNSYETRSEARSNTVTARRYVDAYRACIENKRNNKPLPADMTEI